MLLAENCTAAPSLLQELAALSEANDTLQQRARQVFYLRNKGRPAVAGGFSQLDGADTRYRCEQ
jgi:hypothetical protein